jgi:hypothetical protein
MLTSIDADQMIFPFQADLDRRVGGKRGIVGPIDLLIFDEWYHWTILFSPPAE